MGILNVMLWQMIMRNERLLRSIKFPNVDLAQVA